MGLLLGGIVLVREASSGARNAAGLPCPNASSGTPWTEVDHPTNLDDGFAALRIHGAAEATSDLEASRLMMLLPLEQRCSPETDKAGGPLGRM
jgi:hypothetical protein